MYNIAICDGDDISSSLLERTLYCYFSVKSISAKIRRFTTSGELARYSGRFDIAFIAVDDNDAGCVRAAKQISFKNPDAFIYILSDKITYLDDAMDLKVFRYLPKTMDVDRLYASLNILTAQIKKITFISNYISVSLKESDVVCIYSKDRKTYVLTVSGFAYPTTISIKNWNYRLLEKPAFIQPHYSFIVNISHVWSFDGEKIVLMCNDGKRVDIFPSQRKIGEFRRRFYLAATIAESKSEHL